MDGSTWVMLMISARSSYQRANEGASGPFTPSLTVRCDSKEKTTLHTLVGGKLHRPLDILLDTGGLQPRGVSSATPLPLTVPKENQVRLLRENMLLRIKLDNGKPARRGWSLLPTSDTIYRYVGNGESGMGGDLLPKQFLKNVFSAKIVMIEFQPIGRDDAFVAEFPVGGLKEEFQRHQECSVN